MGAVEVFQPNAAVPAAPDAAATAAALAKVKGRQKAAVLLISIGTERAAQVFERLRDDEIEALSLEMAKLHFLEPGVADAVLNELAAIVLAYDSLSAGGVEYAREVLERKLANVVQQEYSAAGGIKSLADILNHAGRSTERNVLDAITERDESLGAEVRRLLFVFEDIIKLDDRAIQLILREADQKDLALALRGVADEVKDRILANMSERGAQMLVEEMQFQPPQRKRDIEEAQGRVVAIVRKLEEAGAVVLARTEEDVVF